MWPGKNLINIGLLPGINSNFDDPRVIKVSKIGRNFQIFQIYKSVICKSVNL
jgi:hypothetical protein